MSFEAMSRKEKREFIRQNKTSVPKKNKNKKTQKAEMQDKTVRLWI